MHLDSAQLRAIARRFSRQHALEMLAKGLFWGLTAALLVILTDKIWPFPVTFDPGIIALGGGAAVGVVVGIVALAKRFREEDAARAVDAHFALHEQLASAQEFETKPEAEFASALIAQANLTANAENYLKAFSLKRPRYTSHASIVGACAGLLLFAPPLNTLLPAKRAESAELRGRTTELVELARELREIKSPDETTEELADRLEDLAVRAQKNRLSKEDFLKELDDIQRQLESQMAKLPNQDATQQLKEFEQALEKLDISDVQEAKDLAGRMEALNENLKNGSLKFDQLHALEQTLADQQAKLKDTPELKNLEKELGEMRSEALRQQEERLKNEVDRLLSELEKSANKVDPKTPAPLKEQLKEQAEGLKQQNDQGSLTPQDLNPMKDQAEQLKPHDQQQANQMQTLLRQLEKALQKSSEAQANRESQDAQNAEQQAQSPNSEPQKQRAGQESPPSPAMQSQSEGEKGAPGQKGGQESGEAGQEGQKPGQQGQQGQQGSGASGQGQMSLEEYMEAQPGSAANGQQIPSDQVPQSGNGGAGQPGSGQPGRGSSGSFSGMSSSEMQEWSEMLETWKQFESSSGGVGQCRGGGGTGGGGLGGSGWGMGHDPIGRPSNTGAGEAPSKTGEGADQTRQTLTGLDDFQAIYDPHFIAPGATRNEKVDGIVQEGESAGFTMIKAPNTEEGDAVTPYFSVNPETAETEVQALEDQEIPASLKDLVRDYFSEVEE